MNDDSGEDGPGELSLLSLLPSFSTIASSAAFLSFSLLRARYRTKASVFRICFGLALYNPALMPGARTCIGMGLDLELEDCVVDSLDPGVSPSSSCRLFDMSRRVTRAADFSSSIRLAVRRLKIR